MNRLTALLLIIPTSASFRRQPEAGDAHSPLDGLRDGRLALQDGPPGVEEEVAGRRRQVSGLHRHADAPQEALPLHRLRPEGGERAEAGRQ